MLGLGFFEVLGDLMDTDPVYTSLIAGFAALRIAADVLGAHLAPAQSQYANARRLIADVSDIPLVGTLRSVVDAATIEARWNPNCRAMLVVRLMAYGVRLHDAGRFRPAVDVFDLVARSTDDEDLKLQAIHQQAWSRRMLSHLDEADALYERLEHLATDWSVRRMQFEARLGRARIFLDRGNLPVAEAALVRIADEAFERGEIDVFANACLDLARIAGIRGRPEEVLEYGDRALPFLKHPDHLPRILINMAYAFRELGRQDASRAAGRYAIQATQSAESRAYALILLLNLATDNHDADAAAQARRELRLLSMTPIAAAEFYEAVSREHSLFGRSGEAMACARRMLAVAEEHHLNEHIIRADRAIGDLERNEIPAIYTFRPVISNPESEQRIKKIESGILMLCSA